MSDAANVVAVTTSVTKVVETFVHLGESLATAAARVAGDTGPAIPLSVAAATTPSTDPVGTAPSFPFSMAHDVNDTFVYNGPVGGPITFAIVTGGTSATVGDMAQLASAIASAKDSLNRTFSQFVNVVSTSLQLVFSSVNEGSFDNGATITAGPNDLLSTIGITPPITLSGGSDGNNQFVYTPASTGIPETFTAAPGPCSTQADCIAAMAAAIGSLSGERFDTIITPSDSGEIGTLGEADGALFSLPITIATGVNDEFVLTPLGGPPQTCTVAPGTYTNDTAGLSALGNALDAAMLPFPTGFNEFTPAIGAPPGPVAMVFEALDDGWVISAGTNDILPTLGVTGPLTTSGATPNSILLTAVVLGVAHNGDTISAGANDVANALGFTANPDTFHGGIGGEVSPEATPLFTITRSEVTRVVPVS